jgi:CRISPR-associated protein Cas1
MEPYRPTIDFWVWQLFREGPLRQEHFGHDGTGACLLNKAGRGYFYAAWEETTHKRQRSMNQYAQALGRAFQTGDLTSNWNHLIETRQEDAMA